MEMEEVTKMKKFFLVSAAIILFSLTKAIAGGPFYGIPEGPNQALATADYGGVDITTIAFSSANAVCFTGVGSVVGFILSSGTSVSDFVLFRSTDSLISGAIGARNPGNAADDYLVTNEISRVYVATTASVSGSTVNYGSSQLGTTYMFPKPIRVYRGLTAKVSVATYNMLTILWNKLDR